MVFYIGLKYIMYMYWSAHAYLYVNFVPIKLNSVSPLGVFLMPDFICYHKRTLFVSLKKVYKISKWQNSVSQSGVVCRWSALVHLMRFLFGTRCEHHWFSNWVGAMCTCDSTGYNNHLLIMCRSSQQLRNSHEGW